MDGTLIDSTPAVERAWSLFADDHGLDIAAILPTIHGAPADASIRRWLPGASEDEVETERVTMLERECTDTTGIVAMPGALDMIAFLDEHEIPWVVATSAVPRLALIRMGAAGIHPPRLVTPDDVEHGKPAPDTFIEAARVLGSPSERCLAFEDSATGLASAQASGAVVVNVGPQGVSLADVLGDLVV